MSKRIIQSLILVNLIICFTACEKAEIDNMDQKENNRSISDQNADIIDVSSHGSDWSDLKDDEFGDVLEGEVSFKTDDGEELITELDYNNEIWYCLADIDNDSQDELFIKSRTETYVIDKREDNYYEAYVGKDYDIPINNGELSGILYYKIGAAPHHETYAFTTISESGEVEEVIHATWYDGNENDEMDDGDLFFLDVYEDIPVEKDLWLEKTSKYIELKDINVDWKKIQI